MLGRPRTHPDPEFSSLCPDIESQEKSSQERPSNPNIEEKSSQERPSNTNAVKLSTEKYSVQSSVSTLQLPSERCSTDRCSSSLQTSSTWKRPSGLNSLHTPPDLHETPDRSCSEHYCIHSGSASGSFLQIPSAKASLQIPQEQQRDQSPSAAFRQIPSALSGLPTVELAACGHQIFSEENIDTGFDTGSRRSSLSSLGSIPPSASLFRAILPAPSDGEELQNSEAPYVRVVEPVKRSRRVETKHTLGSKLLGKGSRLEHMMFRMAVQNYWTSRCLWSLWLLGVALGLTSLMEVIESHLVWCSVLMLPLPTFTMGVLSVDLVLEVLTQFEYYLITSLQVFLAAAAAGMLRDVRVIFWLCFLPSMLIATLIDAYPHRYRRIFSVMFFTAMQLMLLFWAAALTFRLIPIHDALFEIAYLEGKVASTSCSIMVTLTAFCCRHLYVSIWKPDHFVLILGLVRTLKVQVRAELTRGEDGNLQATFVRSDRRESNLSVRADGPKLKPQSTFGGSTGSEQVGQAEMSMGLGQSCVSVGVAPVGNETEEEGRRQGSTGEVLPSSQDPHQNSGSGLLKEGTLPAVDCKSALEDKSTGPSSLGVSEGNQSGSALEETLAEQALDLQRKESVTPDAEAPLQLLTLGPAAQEDSSPQQGGPPESVLQQPTPEKEASLTLDHEVGLPPPISALAALEISSPEPAFQQTTPQAEAPITPDVEVGLMPLTLGTAAREVSSPQQNGSPEPTVQQSTLETEAPITPDIEAGLMPLTLGSVAREVPLSPQGCSQQPCVQQLTSESEATIESVADAEPVPLPQLAKDSSAEHQAAQEVSPEPGSHQPTPNAKVADALTNA